MTGWDRPTAGECLCGQPHPCPSHGAWAGRDDYPHPPLTPDRSRAFSDEERRQLRQLGIALDHALNEAESYPARAYPRPHTGAA